jgi:hypothetical protein
MATRFLPAAAMRALDVLYQHRLVSTSQLRQIVLPERSVRWTQEVVAELGSRGLAASVPVQRPWPAHGERAWYVTRHGAALIESVPTRTETRRRLLTPELAAGGLQAHTLGVNDVGIAFLRAARERGHDFGPASWRHEVAHDLRAGPRQRRDLLVVDAVLRYWVVSPADRAALRYRFLELDRATVLMDDLAAKLARYAVLFRRWSEHWSAASGSQAGRPAWPQLYRAFPKVLVVLANRERANLTTRMETVIALCRSDPVLARTPEVAIFLVLFDELLSRGPFASIFRRLEDDRPVDWLGNTVSHD